MAVYEQHYVHKKRVRLFNKRTLFLAITRGRYIGFALCLGSGVVGGLWLKSRESRII